MGRQLERNAEEIGRVDAGFVGEFASEDVDESLHPNKTAIAGMVARWAFIGYVLEEGRSIVQKHTRRTVGIPRWGVWRQEMSVRGMAKKRSGPEWCPPARQISLNTRT